MMKKINKNISEHLNYFLEEDNLNKGLFHMNKNNGQVFLEENVANFNKNKYNNNSEYELKIRVEMDKNDKGNIINIKIYKLILYCYSFTLFLKKFIKIFFSSTCSSSSCLYCSTCFK
jgi:hypothetical protein